MSNNYLKGPMSYTTKDKTRVDGPWESAKKLEDVYVPKVNSVDQLRPWQKLIVESIEQEPDERTVNWIVDFRGGRGKTVLSKYIVYHKLGVALRHCNAKDGNYIIANCSPFPRSVIYDLPRVKAAEVSQQDTYNMAEGVADGFVLSVKFKPIVKMTKPGHIWVFSNYPPDQSAMSQDRWKIWQFDKNENLVPFKEEDYNEYCKEQFITKYIKEQESKKRTADWIKEAEDRMAKKQRIV